MNFSDKENIEKERLQEEINKFDDDTPEKVGEILKTPMLSSSNLQL